MSREQGKIIPFSEIRDTSGDITRVSPQQALEGGYSSLVIIPYSSNLREYGPKRGTSGLSFFSKLATVAAARLFKEGSFDNILLVGEDTFGGKKKDTAMLMHTKLLQLGIPNHAIRGVSQRRNQNNTAFQMEAVAERQCRHGDGKPFLLIDWDFHDERVRTNARAYGLHADTTTVEDTLAHFFPHVDLEKYNGVLDQFTEHEHSFLMRLLGGGKGSVLKAITRLRGGRMTDIRVIKGEDGKKKLDLLVTTGRKRLKEINSQS